MPDLKAVLLETCFFYETGSTVSLHNDADTSIALYKDQALTNTMILFRNGIKATITDYRISPDKPTAYKVRILLKDSSEYIGWIPEGVIKEH